MAVSVWADVGGTFTDCIVRDSAGRRETKVLSSGMIRAAVVDIVDQDTLRLKSTPASTIAQFWRSASVSLLDDHGRATQLGTITDQRQNTISLSLPLPNDFPNRSPIIEIDAGLEAPVLATRFLLGIPLERALPKLDLRMGTTRGTNALLTRSGSPTALFVTRGFADILRIGDQDRPDLFAMTIVKPPTLTETVVEVTERLDARGNVLEPIDLDLLHKDLDRVRQSGIDSIAICLMHSHVNDAHELAAEHLALQTGFKNVSCSSKLARLIKLVSRAETSTLDAYLHPVLAGYINRVWNQFGGEDRCRFRLMTSGGNLVAPDAFRGKDSILSGPAGGVVALRSIARAAGTDHAVGLDMGGTSTDVSRFVGRIGRRYESRVAGVRVMTPMMDIETIAAGGGSICAINSDQRMTVGPASAGADPGPACYGRGGPLTVTDINLLLGRIPTEWFPFPLHFDAAKAQLDLIRNQAPDTIRDASDEQLAEGFLQIAVTHMAEAVRNVSTAQGSDVRKMALVGFGGAAGQHVCRIAQSLGMDRIIDHPDAGLMSALGMGLATIGRVTSRGIYQPLDESINRIAGIANELKSSAEEMLRPERENDQACEFDLQCDLRYLGTESSLTVPSEPNESLAKRFHALHQATFGYVHPDRPIELVNVRCEATLPNAPDEVPARPETAQQSTDSKRIWHQGQWIEAKLLNRNTLQTGDDLPVPAMIVGRHSTLLVEPGWKARVINDGIIELSSVPVDVRSANDAQGASFRRSAELGINRSKVGKDPVLLEVITRRLQGIADAMGEVLRRTAISVNIKERRDYSCAIFRADGALIANAPHVPVHLGAMGHTVRHLIRTFPMMSPGDCYLSNDPFAGGSHLPDLTVVTPVFCADEGSPTFFVASRAHHAEIGGRTPGSMPPDATSLAEEGILIRAFALVRSGNLHRHPLEKLLSAGPYPSRKVDENLADIAAQQAAGTHGAAALRDLAEIYSPVTVDAYMSGLLDIAADSMQRWITLLDDQPKRFRDTLDDGSDIAVLIQRRDTRLAIEFESSNVHANGFNATPAIVTAAVLYVVRSISGSDLPLCDGVLRDVDIYIPPGMLNPPAHEDPAQCAAVVAGNVETSQRIVDVLLGALGVAAASQGTMNNVLMGDDSFGYYETIGGGSGATEDADGADAVHTHMTNTRITDPEVLESRLPVRLHRFAIRQGSGGAGKHRGGNGMIREFEFLEPLEVSLLTGRRTKPPYGVHGGQPGQRGRNILIHNGLSTDLPSTASFNVLPGDRLIIETPGGGGWGDQ